MTAQTQTLVDFLLDRFAEEEAEAHAAATEGARWEAAPVGHEDADDDAVRIPWVRIAVGAPSGETDAEGIPLVVPIVYDEGTPDRAQAAHIARHDPARVLAECEAKRQIVEVECRDFYDPEILTEAEALRYTPGGWILRALALAYADHPEYREEWRPRNAKKPPPA